MGYQEKFTEEELTELIGDDLSLPGSLATLITENGDIRAFLVSKLKERAARLEETEAQESDWKDWNRLQDSVDTEEARYINQRYFG